MNRYIFLHRIKWPVMLLVFGVTALLDQWGVLSYDQSWPLYLIVFGLLLLAERAAWSQAQNPGPTAGYPPGSPTGYPGQPGNWGGPAAQPPSTSLTVTPQDRPHGFGPEDEGR